MALQISLSASLEKLIHKEVESGTYNTVNEVVSEALGYFFNSNMEPTWAVANIKQRADALASGGYEGRLIDGESLFADLAKEYPDEV